jgi:phosphatidylserine/phosphatidylglycerophosphate/cardiolipin synthase-like enzyme
VLISTQHSPSYFDQATMDKTRFDFISHLKAADPHHRFQAYSPVTTLGLTIIVHAKLTIIDDGLLRIGSANINNRSMGFDTECDLVLEASGDTEAASRRRIQTLRTELLAHWLGCSHDIIDGALKAQAGRVTLALEALRNGGYTRLRPIVAGEMNPVSALVSKHHVGDPVAASDAWKPWRSSRALRDNLAGFGFDPVQAKLVPQR